jgi:GTP-binding protein
LKVLSADFVTSATAAGGAGGIPRDGLPQIALAGRSNVGKSSLINALCRRTIARTSAAPGKTRLANIYRVTLEGRRDLYLVDLPGYGYARGGAESAHELRAIAEGYFTHGRGWDSASAEKSGPSARASTSPEGVLLLVDSRHPRLESDVAAHAWLASIGVDPHVVAAKVDKLTRAERVRNLKTLEDVFGTAAVPVSAQSGEGLNELWQLITRLAKRQ